MLLNKREKKPGLKFNHGSKLIGLRITGPGFFPTDVHSLLEFGQQFSGNKSYSVH